MVYHIFLLLSDLFVAVSSSESRLNSYARSHQVGEVDGVGSGILVLSVEAL
jgi:hypothetical protein